MGKRALEDHFDTEGWEYVIVKTGDTLNIGKRTLEFVTTPMLHWPDSMMTYVKEDKLLLSNDGFGQHYATDALFVKEAPFAKLRAIMPIFYSLTALRLKKL